MISQQLQRNDFENGRKLFGRGGNVENVIRGFLYFLVAFGFSWLMFLPGPLTYYGVISLSDDVVRLFAIAGLLGPILSGFIMTAVTEGRPGIVRLLRRMVCWRVGIRWYAFALVGLPVTMVLGTFIRPGAAESFDISARPILAGLPACLRLYGSLRRTAL